MKTRQNPKSSEIERMERLLTVKEQQNRSLRRQIIVLREKIRELIVEISP